GFRVSVTVVDRAGLPIVMLRGDGAGLHTPEGSDRKAYTARTFRAPSADFVQRMLNDPALGGQKEYTRVLALGGGLPIKVGDAALKAAAPQPGERVIDIGCGCGDTSIEIARLVGAGGSVLGVDVSQPMLEVALTHGGLANCAHVAFRDGDASEAELPANID